MDKKSWFILLGLVAVAMMLSKKAAAPALNGVIHIPDAEDITGAIDRQTDVIEAGYRS